MLSFFAAAFELLGLYVVGTKNKVGFILNMVGGLFWVFVALQYQIWGLLLVAIIAVVLNARNFKRWKSEEFQDKLR